MYVYACGCIIQFPNGSMINVLINKDLYPLAIPAKDHSVAPRFLRINGKADTSASKNLQALPSENDTPVCPDLISMSHSSYQSYMKFARSLTQQKARVGMTAVPEYANRGE